MMMMYFDAEGVGRNWACTGGRKATDKPVAIKPYEFI
jgi:hypothetical protein